MQMAKSHRWQPLHVFSVHCFPARRLRLGDGGGSFAAARWSDFSRPSEAGDNGPRHCAQLCPVGLQWRGPGQELVGFKMNIQKHIIKLSSNWEKWIPIQESLSIQNILTTVNFYNDMAMHYCQIPSQLLSTAMHMAWLHGLHLLGFV